MSEEKRIMDFLGIGNLQGNVHGQHLGKILTYLKIMNTEELSVTLSKLSLTCSMGQRYVKENYLEGLANWGIIRLYQNGNALFWRWEGIKALNGKNPIGELIEPPKPEDKPKKEKKLKPEKHVCKNCEKEIPKDNMYCNEECVRGYYDKLKKEGKSINYNDVWNDVKDPNNGEKENE